MENKEQSNETPQPQPTFTKGMKAVIGVLVLIIVLLIGFCFMISDAKLHESGVGRDTKRQIFRPADLEFTADEDPAVAKKKEETPDKEEKILEKTEKAKKTEKTEKSESSSEDAVAEDGSVESNTEASSAPASDVAPITSDQEKPAKPAIKGDEVVMDDAANPNF